MNFNEDDRAQRLFDIVEELPGQINVSYVASTAHVVAWHMHPFKQVDYWCCLKGSFKVGLKDDAGGMRWEYLSDKNPRVLKIEPGTWHGYKALQPDSIMLYYLTEKWDPMDEFKCPPGSFGEVWETDNK